MFKNLTLTLTMSAAVIGTTHTPSFADAEFVFRSPRTGIIPVAAASAPEAPDSGSTTAFLQFSYSGGWIYECETELSQAKIDTLNLSSDTSPAFMHLDHARSDWTGDPTWSAFDSDSRFFGLPWMSKDDFDSWVLSDLRDQAGLASEESLCVSDMSIAQIGTVGETDYVDYIGGQRVKR